MRPLIGVARSRQRILAFAAFMGLIFSLLPAVQSSAAEPLTAGTECGTIQVRGPQLVDDPSAALEAETCFLQAYNQRQPATLVLQVMGIDTMATHIFTLGTESGQYALTDSAEFRVIPRPVGTTNLYTCSGLTQTANGLLATACGDEGDVLIPAPQPGMPTTGRSQPTDLRWGILAALALLLLGIGARFPRSVIGRRKV
ncbi:MAG: hypothetical protein ACJ78Q_15350 [Chloroflexia bacterium]